MDGRLRTRWVEGRTKDLQRPASFPEGTKSSFCFWTWQCRDEGNFILRQLNTLVHSFIVQQFETPVRRFPRQIGRGLIIVRKGRFNEPLLILTLACEKAVLILRLLANRSGHFLKSFWLSNFLEFCLFSCLKFFSFGLFMFYL
jgi:hypothetical protein